MTLRSVSAVPGPLNTHGRRRRRLPDMKTRHLGVTLLSLLYYMSVFLNKMMNIDEPSEWMNRGNFMGITRINIYIYIYIMYYIYYIYYILYILYIYIIYIYINMSVGMGLISLKRMIKRCPASSQKAHPPDHVGRSLGAALPKTWGVGGVYLRG